MMLSGRTCRNFDISCPRYGNCRDLKDEYFNVIAVIGDGSMGAGMAFEAINHAGHLGTKLIVILNDNGMAISPSVGALTRIFNQVRNDSRYELAKQTARKAITHLPFGNAAWKLSKRMKSGMEAFCCLVHSGINLVYIFRARRRP